MKMPTSMYHYARSGAATPGSNTQLPRHHESGYRSPTTESAMNHPDMATRHEGSTRESRRASSSKGTQNPVALPLVFFMAAPRPAKSVRWKEDHELTTSIVIPNKEQMRELERTPEASPRCHHDRRCCHSHSHGRVEEPTRDREGRGGARGNVNAPAEDIRGPRGESRRRR